MPLVVNDAGVMPAFVDYAWLGTSLGLLARQFAAGETVHAYLLQGAQGVGKATFARYLAMNAFCTAEEKPCGHCEACSRFLSGNEPDLLEVYGLDGKQILIDRVREVIERISQHSFGTGPRVVLIEPIEKLTPQAQNCLLKSLEEPPSNVIFLLMAHETSAVLGTIASRCCRVKMAPWPDDILRDTLLKRGFSPQAVDEVLPKASGNIGQAIAILDDQDRETEMKAVVQSALNVKSDADVVTLSTKWKDDREGAEQALTAIEQALYHMVLIRTQRLPESAATEKWQRAALHAPLAELTELLQTVFQTRKLRQSQVNWQTSVDHLLMKLLEAKTRWLQL